MITSRSPAGSLDPGVSMEKRFVRWSRSGNTNNSLPPLLFKYSHFNLDDALLNSLAPEPQLELGGASGNVQIVDVDVRQLLAQGPSAADCKSFPRLRTRLRMP